MSHVTAEYNILIGVLAVQNGLISKETLFKAMSAWTSDKSQSIGQILVDSENLSSDDFEILLPMVRRHIAKNGGDVIRGLEEISSFNHVVQDLFDIQDDELHQTLQVLKVDNKTVVVEMDENPLMSGESDGETKSAVWPRKPPKGGWKAGRFRIITELGGGGMGKVYEGYDDDELGRRVAIKMVREENIRDDATLQNYRVKLKREGEINGKLEHPNIIPVYGLGTTDDGRPFYAMRFIDKINLQHAIKNFHSGRDLLDETLYKMESIEPEDKATVREMDRESDTLPNLKDHKSQIVAEKIFFHKITGSRKLAFRELLERFTDICNAIDYAHSRRVLHRDLKPGNIMLGEHGETLVIDWGLAKTKADIQSKRSVSESLDTLEVQFDEDEQQTIQGELKGTLSYMSPEQLSGDLTQINEFSDIYSLGVILYEILTGHAPYYDHKMRDILKGIRNVREKALYLLREIRNGVPDPRRHNHTIPRPLAAICTKALAPDPSERYKTARLLAVDIERWLADETVSAYQENMMERSRRWAKRNRSVVGVLLTAIICLGVGSVIFGLEQSHYNLELSRERSEAVRQRNLAVQNEESAINQRKQAEHNANIATVQREISEQRLYFNNIKQAKLEWENGNAEIAKDILQSIPFSRRGWEHHYLTSLMMQNHVVLEGHTSPVRHVEFSPDSSILLSVSNHEVIIWDTLTGKRIKQIPASEAWMTKAVFSRDGKCFAISTSDHLIRIIDCASGQIRATHNHHKSLIKEIAFINDNERLLSTDVDSNLILWDIRKSAIIYNIKSGAIPILNIAIHPNGKVFYCVESGITCRNIDDGTLITTLKGNGDSGELTNISISSDGLLLTSGGQVNSPKLWDLKSNKETTPFQNEPRWVFDVCFSHDSKSIASVGYSKAINIYDVGSGNLVRSLKGHTQDVLAVDVSSEGRRIASGGLDRTVRIWSFLEEQLPTTFRPELGWIGSIGIHPTRDEFAIGGQVKSPAILSLTTGDRYHSLQGHQTPDKHTDVNSVDYSPNGDLLASASNDKTIRIWDAHNYSEKAVLKDHEKEVNIIAFSPDGSFLASGSSDSTIKIWDLSTYSLNRTFNGHRDPVFALSISPDSQIIASGSMDGILHIWDRKKGTQLHSIDYQDNDVNALLFPPGNHHILVGLSNGVLKLIDLRTRKEIYSVKKHSAGIRSITMSPDSSRIITTSDDFDIRVSDLKSGIEALTLKGHLFNVSEARFTKDSKHILSTSEDMTVKKWIADCTEQFLRLNGTSSVVSLDWSSDGRQIIALDDRNEKSVWDFESGQLIVDHSTPIRRPDLYQGRVSPNGIYRLSIQDGHPLITHLGYLKDLNQRNEGMLKRFAGISINKENEKSR